jgi:oligopeptide/dipeptide ABC transporter ATP-binding protein
LKVWAENGVTCWIETEPAEEIYRNPSHPYTEALLADIPVEGPTIRKKHILLKGDIPSPTHIPPGCRFHCKKDNVSFREAVDKLRGQAPVARVQGKPKSLLIPTTDQT